MQKVVYKLFERKPPSDYENTTRGDEFVVRECLAGRGQRDSLHAALHLAGFATRGRLDRMVAEKLIACAYGDVFVARCPNVGCRCLIMLPIDKHLGPEEAE